jgi:hypothetical protein
LLYLQAGKDRLVKARNFGLVQRRYSGVQVERIESPHLILQVKPEASVRAIFQFLATMKPGADGPAKNSFSRPGGSWFSGAR